MIRKKLLIWAVVFLLGLPTFAQFSLSFSTGYTIPFLGWKKDPGSENSGLKFFPNYNRYIKGYGDSAYSVGNWSYSNRKPAYAVYNSGLNFNLSFGYQLKNWLRISADLFYLNNKYIPYKRETKDYILTNNFHNFTTVVDSNNCYTTIFKESTDMRVISPMLNFEFIKSFNKIEILPFFKIGFSIYKTTINRDYMTFEKNGSYLLTSSRFILTKTKFFSYQIGTKVSYNISNKISLFAGITFLDYGFTPDKAKYTSDNFSYSHYIWQVREDYDLSSLSSESGYILHHKHYMFPGNSINYSIGIRYSFGKKQKKDEKNE